MIPRSPRAKRSLVLVLVAVAVPAALYACVEPPPKIASIPPAGLAIRLHVFGAKAEDARHTFEAAKQNNKGFSVVKEGGDGEVVVGLENDSPKCVQPTALCSFKVSYRIKDREGHVVHASTTSVVATSDRCPDLCAKALVSVATKVIDTAAGLLASGAPAMDEAGAESSEAGASAIDVAALGDASTAAVLALVDAGAAPAPAPAKKKPGKAEATAPKPEPVLCAVGAGPRLPADEAERRAAQVEVLKRIDVLDQAEYDCLRKAYLGRL